MAKKSSNAKKDLAEQTDPRATLDSAALLAASKAVLARLEADLLERVKASRSVNAALEARYQAEKANNRTAESFGGWTSALATQVGAAWLLSCVFVRTLEDRGLLKQNRLAGPGAEDSQRQFFALAPSLTERDYLLTLFRELSHHRAAKALFDTEHSLVWTLSPSAELAKELLALFRGPNATAPAFRFGQSSTRFLGDLYQDLSEEVRKRYALLQTPVFVEEFILDRTLEPAITRFGLDDTTLIDPTCGSGHFLLGAFERLFEHRLRAEPGIDPRTAAAKSLDAVYGADINPYAVAIARFRLALTFFEKAGYTKLADAPTLPLHVVVADSLRINPQHPQTELWHQQGISPNSWLGDVFSMEDERSAKDVLFRQYAAVVGNPPYITVKDAAVRDVYRAMYPQSAHRNFALAAPFCERFFGLARPRGYVGEITANSFMKREFGSKLVEDFLPTVNLELIANSSGAHIPGHGTPTLLLFGTNEAPVGTKVLAVLAKRGEPSAPDDPSQGFVWKSLRDHFSDVGFENEFVSVAWMDRGVLAKHPWSLGGGGAAELKELLEARADRRLGDIISLPIGRAARIGADDVFAVPNHVADSVGGEGLFWREFLVGEAVRDWSIGPLDRVIFPYDPDNGFVAADPSHPALSNILRFMWPWRTHLLKRATFHGTMSDAGRQWFEYVQFTRSSNATPLSIVFAFVGTHNHFALDRGGKAFNKTAPVVKLPASATESDHHAVLAYLNSSTACFWMKQVFFDKGNQGGERGRPSEPFEAYFEFDGTKLAGLPIPNGFNEAKPELAALAQELEATSMRRVQLLDLSTIFAESPSVTAINDGVAARLRAILTVQASIRALQEKLDWKIYQLFGLTTHAPQLCDGREAGARLCDYRWARDGIAAGSSVRYFTLCHVGDPKTIASTEWIERWGLELDEQAALRSDGISMIETPAYKRTYKDSFGAVDVRGQGRAYLIRELERCISIRVDVVTLHDLSFDSRKGLEPAFDWCERFSLGVISELLLESSVPFGAACRYSESGMAIHTCWEALWQDQRAADRGESSELVVAPQYTSEDFNDHIYYRMRGRLDVPKERFISYPHCESDSDGEPVYGWAGWSHLQRANALASLYLKRRDGEGWTADRLTPMLAGLLELIPWVTQWHNEPSSEYGGLRMGDYFAQFLDGECRRHNLTHDDLRAWRPPKKTRGKAKSAASTVGGVIEASKRPRGRRNLKASEDAAIEPEAE